ncbi:MAG: hypothetical protein KZQ58_11220 [gamma proteobacterium symbiont of Bathyaustriella thionipta]|nr:hypothetical protein [gamma proteobacterium symbiont of Bathyaustriella thionipta]
MDSASSTSVVTDQQRQQAAEHANSTQLLAALENIRAFHERNNSGLQLQAALPAAEFERLSAAFPCVIPDELQTLWSWRNGESSDVFIWYHRFLPLQEALSQYRILSNTPFSGWSRYWIPVFSYEGEWYGLECGDKPRSGSPLILYTLEDAGRLAYRNLGSYLQSMSRALDEGAIIWQQDGWNAMDGAKPYSRIFSELNPGIAFPYYIKP